MTCSLMAQPDRLARSPVCLNQPAAFDLNCGPATMSMLTIIYTVLFYAASGVFVIGLIQKIRCYAITPAPLKIPTPPAPITAAGVGWRMAREVVLFESLFKSSKWTWILGWV